MTIITISNDSVRAVWFCPECYKAERVEPTFYQEAGVPMCANCDVEMRYMRTEIELPLEGFEMKVVKGEN